MENAKRNTGFSSRRIMGLIMLVVFGLAFLFSCLCGVTGVGRILVGTFGYMVFPLTIIFALISLAIFLDLSYSRSIKSTVLLVLSIFSILFVIASIASYSALSNVVDVASYKAYLSSHYNNFTLLGSCGGILSGLIAMLLGAMGTIVVYVVLSTIFIGLFVDYQLYGKYEQPHIKKLKSRKMKEKVLASDSSKIRSNSPDYSFESENEFSNDEVLSSITMDENGYRSAESIDLDYTEEDVVDEISDEVISSASSAPYENYSNSGYNNEFYLNEEQNANKFDNSSINEVNSPYPDVYSYDPNEDRRRFMKATFGMSEPEQTYDPKGYEYDSKPAYTESVANFEVKPQNEQPSQSGLNLHTFEKPSENSFVSSSFANSNETFEVSEQKTQTPQNSFGIDDEISKILSQSDDDIESDVKNDFTQNSNQAFSGVGFASALRNDEPQLNSQLANDFDKRPQPQMTNAEPQTPKYVNSNMGQTSGIENLSPNIGFGTVPPQPQAPQAQVGPQIPVQQPPVQTPVQQAPVQTPVQNSQYVVPSSPAQSQSAMAMEKKNLRGINMGMPGIKYNPPPLNLLQTPKPDTGDYSEEQERKSANLEKVLAAFNIPAKVKNIVRGPKITRYELSVPLGISVKRIPMIENDIAAALAAKTITIKAPIPGSSYVGIELENDTFTTVYERELLESTEFQNFKDPLPIAIGKDISGEIVVKSLAKMVHLLIAGSTGSGKSVFIHNIVMSLIYKLSPDDLRLIMIDPKKVEFNRYNGLPHLLTPEVVMGAEKAINALKWSVKEMDRRYSLMSQAGYNNIEPYNRSELVKAGQFEKFPYIVIIVDELAEIMQVNKKEVDACIQRITQLARACGMHMILATQRPSVDIISGVIKNNVPSRIAFSLQSGIDSKTILNAVGAEKLLGQGDMIFAPTGTSATPRLQASYASDDEIKAVIDYTINNNQSSYDETVENIINSDDPYGTAEASSGGGGGDGGSRDGVDDYFKAAVKFVMQNGAASVSYLQRKLSVGYSRAARIVDQMEEKGYIGGATGSKTRKVIITPEQFRQDFGEDFNSID